MLRREFITFIGAAAAGWPLVARAQQTDRVRRIGALMDIGETDAGAKGWVEAFETSLDASGWHNGHNCAIDYRWGASNPSALLAMPRNFCNQRRTFFWCMVRPH